MLGGIPSSLLFFLLLASCLVSAENSVSELKSRSRENARLINFSLKSSENVNYGKTSVSISTLPNSQPLAKLILGIGKRDHSGSLLLRNEDFNNSIQNSIWFNIANKYLNDTLGTSVKPNAPLQFNIASKDYKLKIASSVQKVEYLYQPQSNDANGCACVQGNCACCLEIKLPEFDHSVCVNATYNKETVGLDLSIGIDGHFFTEEISVRNPPPICFDLPIPGAEPGVCIAFTDLDLDRARKTLSGCVEFEVELVHLRVVQFKIGCFRMPL